MTIKRSAFSDLRKEKESWHQKNIECGQSIACAMAMTGTVTVNTQDQAQATKHMED
jgi:hypothetical protein